MNPSEEKAEAAPEPGRRRALRILSNAFLGLWGLGGLGVLGAYLAPRHTERLAERVVHVGPLDQFRIGEGRLIRYGVTPLIIIRLDQAQFSAVSAVCTHVRCILNFDAQRKAIVCPCHDGRFDLSGNVVSGPPPRPLVRYEVAVRAGEVYVQL